MAMKIVNKSMKIFLPLLTLLTSCLGFNQVKSKPANLKMKNSINFYSFKMKSIDGTLIDSRGHLNHSVVELLCLGIIARECGIVSAILILTNNIILNELDFDLYEIEILNKKGIPKKNIKLFAGKPLIELDK